jgi:hypothetical protein
MDEQQKEQFRKAVDEKTQQDEARVEANEKKLIDTEKPQDTLSVRAKSSGHGKKTADKWNQ